MLSFDLSKLPGAARALAGAFFVLAIGALGGWTIYEQAEDVGAEAVERADTLGKAALEPIRVELRAINTSVSRINQDIDRRAESHVAPIETRVAALETQLSDLSKTLRSEFAYLRSRLDETRGPKPDD